MPPPLRVTTSLQSPDGIGLSSPAVSTGLFLLKFNNSRGSLKNKDSNNASVDTLETLCAVGSFPFKNELLSFTQILVSL